MPACARTRRLQPMKSMRYVVIGIGKYGSRIALEMAGRGAEVFAIDCVEEKVEEVSDDIALAITMDSTDPKALRSQKLEEMDAAVVAIGDNFEATVLTTINLLDLGIPRVIVRASGPHQERILRSLGVQEILAPEAEFASIVAERLMNPNLRGFLELPEDFGIAEIKAPAGVVGRTLGDIDLTARYDLRLITIRRTYDEGGQPKEHLIGIPRPDTTVESTDTLVVFGTLGNVNRFLEVNE